MTSKFSASFIVLPLVLSGCASLIGGDDQKLFVSSNPPGANCTLNRAGRVVAKIESTPAAVTVTRTKDDIKIDCNLAGYRPASVVDQSGSGKNNSSTIALSSGAGAAMDSEAGAEQKFDSIVNITLVPRQQVARRPPRARTPAANTPSLPASSARNVIPLELKNNGIYAVPAVINGVITVSFTVDSGASTVVIPDYVYDTLKSAGFITEADLRGASNYTLADGSTGVTQSFRIRSLKVGDLVIEDVLASITPTKGSLLLGQSFLGRLKSWSIDNISHSLIID